MKFIVFEFNCFMVDLNGSDMNENTWKFWLKKGTPTEYLFKTPFTLV